jgi:hypothetical protein
MITHSLHLITIKDRFNLRCLFSGQGYIHQTSTRTDQQAISGKHDINSNSDSDQGVQPDETCYLNENDTNQHTTCRPHIGHQVTGICFQGNRVISFSSTHQHQRHTKVYQGSDNRDQQPQPHLLQGDWIDQAWNSIHDNTCCSEKDHATLKTTGEIFDLIKPKGKFITCRA